MKTRFNNETEFIEYTNGLKNDNTYDRHFVDQVPVSYPCIVLFHSETTYFGDSIISTIDIIYPADFN
jgi:hypothetical protein